VQTLLSQGWKDRCSRRAMAADSAAITPMTPIKTNTGGAACYLVDASWPSASELPHIAALEPSQPLKIPESRLLFIYFAARVAAYFA
jgi:hypothetical protein